MSMLRPSDVAIPPKELQGLEAIIEEVKKSSSAWRGRDISYLSPRDDKLEFILAIVHGPCLIQPEIKIELLFELEDGTSHLHIHPGPRGLITGVVSHTSFDSITVQLVETGEEILRLDDVIRGLFPVS